MFSKFCLSEEMGILYFCKFKTSYRYRSCKFCRAVLKWQCGDCRFCLWYCNIKSPFLNAKGRRKKTQYWLVLTRMYNPKDFLCVYLDRISVFQLSHGSQDLFRKTNAKQNFSVSLKQKARLPILKWEQSASQRLHWKFSSGMTSLSWRRSHGKISCPSLHESS